MLEAILATYLAIHVAFVLAFCVCEWKLIKMEWNSTDIEGSPTAYRVMGVLAILTLSPVLFFNEFPWNNR